MEEETLVENEENKKQAEMFPLGARGGINGVKV